MELSRTSRIVKAMTLESVFYKYGSNVAKSAQLKDYLVIKYVLDFGHGKLDELYGCFDLAIYVLSKDGIREHHHFATYTFAHFTTPISLTFPTFTAAEEEFPWQLEGSRIFQLHHQHL